MICHPGRIDPDRDMIWDEQGIERGVHIQVCADRNSSGMGVLSWLKLDISNLNIGDPPSTIDKGRGLGSPMNGIVLLVYLLLLRAPQATSRASAPSPTHWAWTARLPRSPRGSAGRTSTVRGTTFISKVSIKIKMWEAHGKVRSGHSHYSQSCSHWSVDQIILRQLIISQHSSQSVRAFQNFLTILDSIALITI